MYIYIYIYIYIGTKVNAKTPDGCLIWTQQITSHTKQVMAVYYDTYNPTTSFYISSNGSFFYNHSNKIMVHLVIYIYIYISMTSILRISCFACSL